MTSDGYVAVGRVIASPICENDFERFLLVNSRFARRAALRLLVIGFALATLSTLAPNVSHAEIIYFIGLQGQVSDEFEIGIWQDLIPSADPPAPTAPSKRPEPPVPEEPKAPHVDAGLDVADDATTSAPVPSAGSAAQAGLASANLHFSLSGASRRIRRVRDALCELRD